MAGTATAGSGGVATGAETVDAEPALASETSSQGSVPSPRGPEDVQPVSPKYTPLFHAQHDGRYLRRTLIREYQKRYGCRLAVMSDVIDPDGVTLFCELIYDSDPNLDLHLLLRSPGGDAQVAIRLIRAAQASCRRLVVVVPDIAKSAATILAMGAHEIIMGPTSDLGPIDPQVLVGERGYVSAREIIAAVDTALNDVSARPRTHTLHAGLLGSGGVDATTYQFAKSAMDGTKGIAKQAISSNPDRTPSDIEDLRGKIESSLLLGASLHSTVVGASEARHVGLPVTELALQSKHWQDIWQLWTRYFTIGPPDALSIYEGELASQIRRYSASEQQ